MDIPAMSGKTGCDDEIVRQVVARAGVCVMGRRRDPADRIELTPVDVSQSRGVTHLSYRVARP